MTKKQFLACIEEISRLEGIRQFEALDFFIDISFHTLWGRLLAEKPFEENEAKYLALVKKLRKPKRTLDLIAKLMAITCVQVINTDRDFLGPIYMEIGANEHLGQFFTPPEISELMALATVVDVEETLKTKAAISISEPTCGFGGMVLSIAKSLREKGVDVARRVHFHMVDIDHRCVKASYIQTSVADISATIVHGDVLRLNEFGSYVTPASLAYPKDVAGAPIVSHTKNPKKEESNANAD